MAEKVYVRTLDQQIGFWIGEAMHRYAIETFPKPIYQKILMGGRQKFREETPADVKRFVYRQISKRWQYLNSERIEEFIEEWRSE